MVKLHAIIRVDTGIYPRRDAACGVSGVFVHEGPLTGHPMDCRNCIRIICRSVEAMARAGKVDGA